MLTPKQVEALYERLPEIEKVLPEDQHERAVALTGMLAKFAVSDEDICPICLCEMVLGAYNLMSDGRPNPDKWLHKAIEMAQLTSAVIRAAEDEGSSIVTTFFGQPTFKGES